MIERAAETVPLIASGLPLPPVVTIATIPPASITHLPAISNSGGVHSVTRRPPIIFAAPTGVEVSTILFTSTASPNPQLSLLSITLLQEFYQLVKIQYKDLSRLQLNLS